MSGLKRYGFAIKVTIGMAFAALIHFRIGVNVLYPLATGEFSGPFTPGVEALEVIVPVTIGIILVATWLWVFVSPVQEERARGRARNGGPPRR